MTEYSHHTPHRITISWAGRLFNYTYVVEHTGSTEITYRVAYAKGSIWLVRNIQKDTWRQELPVGAEKLPKNFIDVLGYQIMKDQRPDGWKGKQNP